MKDEGLFHLIDPKAWDTDWNVNIAAVGTGHQTIKYLSQYVFIVAISDYRIETVENGQVSFCYRKTGSNRDRRITVTAHEFIRRYLQHVLPTGLMKVRHYGFMSSNCSVCLSEIKRLIEISLGFEKFQRASSFRGQIRFCRAESLRAFASNSPIETFVPECRAS